MKKVLVLLVSLLVASCAHMPKTASQLNGYFKSTVIVRVDSPEGRWSGTGFSVAQTKGDDAGSDILTNKHVCAAADTATYEITDYSGRKYSAKFVRYAPQADLCLLHTEALVEPVKLAKHDPERGEHVMAVGAPRGEFPNFTDGWISGYCSVDLVGGGIEIHVRALCTSVPIYPGNSGSPIFNDHGKVVGIMFAGRRDSEHMTCAVGVDDIHKFLDPKEDMYYR